MSHRTPPLPAVAAVSSATTASTSSSNTATTTTSSSVLSGRRTLSFDDASLSEDDLQVIGVARPPKEGNDPEDDLEDEKVVVVPKKPAAYPLCDATNTDIEVSAGDANRTKKPTKNSPTLVHVNPSKQEVWHANFDKVKKFYEEHGHFDDAKG